MQPDIDHNIINLLLLYNYHNNRDSELCQDVSNDSARSRAVFLNGLRFAVEQLIGEFPRYYNKIGIHFK